MWHAMMLTSISADPACSCQTCSAQLCQKVEVLTRTGPGTLTAMPVPSRHGPTVRRRVVGRRRVGAGVRVVVEDAALRDPHHRALPPAGRHAGAASLGSKNAVQASCPLDAQSSCWCLPWVLVGQRLLSGFQLRNCALLGTRAGGRNSIGMSMLWRWLSLRFADQVLFDRNYEDAYTDPGSPATARTPLGTYTLAQLAGPGRRLLLQVRPLSTQGFVMECFTVRPCMSSLLYHLEQCAALKGVQVRCTQLAYMAAVNRGSLVECVTDMCVPHAGSWRQPGGQPALRGRPGPGHEGDAAPVALPAALLRDHRCGWMTTTQQEALLSTPAVPLPDCVCVVWLSILRHVVHDYAERTIAALSGAC